MTCLSGCTCSHTDLKFTTCILRFRARTPSSSFDLKIKSHFPFKSSSLYHNGSIYQRSNIVTRHYVGCNVEENHPYCNRSMRYQNNIITCQILIITWEKGKTEKRGWGDNNGANRKWMTHYVNKLEMQESVVGLVVDL